MCLPNINITERYVLINVEFYLKGDLKGYVNAYLHDEENDKVYEVLYRVYDPENGNDFTLVSIDYGWNIDGHVFYLVEQKLTNIAGELRKQL